jgi:hypothetical protein
VARDEGRGLKPKDTEATPISRHLAHLHWPLRARRAARLTT